METNVYNLKSELGYLGAIFLTNMDDLYEDIYQALGYAAWAMEESKC